MRVRLSRKAQGDVRRHIDWLVERSPNAAEKTGRAIFDALGLLAEYPFSGVSIGQNQRETTVRLGHYGFVLRYEIRPDQILVLRLFHGAEDRRRR
ncbi:MAG: type II toxin-antitoxin system RelE/ParE family toxin [Brevundimonas sp.]